jgi:GrpB-like predicted nucleotidyltransferase (UPF0157 family)
MTVRRVEVVPYQTEWVMRYNEGKQEILEIVEPNEIVLHHIGSTSVPGLNAKPIIDILVEVDNHKILDNLTPIFEAEEFLVMGENGIPGRRYFIKNNVKGERLYHVHVFEKGNSEIVRHLAFRDYLRKHPDERERYANVKIEAARKFPLDIVSYINYKDSIIKEIEKKALDWAKGV